MRYFNILVSVSIVVCIVNGCGKKEENNKASTSISDETTKEQISERKKIPTVKKNAPVKRSAIRKDGRILTAEEQLKQYYEEKGIEYTPPSVKRDLHESVRSLDTEVQRSLPHKYIEYKESGDDQNDQSTQYREHVTPSETAASVQSEIENVSDQPEYSDAEPPELLAVRFEPSEVKPGDKVTVIAQAVDNLAGINSIFGVIQNPSGSGTISFHCAVLRDDGMFVGYLTLPEHAQSGNWSIKHVKLTDNVRNTKTYDTRSARLKASYLSVVSVDSDSIPPSLDGILLEPTEADGGEKIQIMIDAHDEQSGVFRIFGVLVSPSRKAKISFSCKFDIDLATFLGHAIIPTDAEAGVWTVDYVRLEDNAKNKSTYYKRNYKELFQSAIVDIHSMNSDSQPPDLQDVMINPPVVAYYEKLTILISAVDDVSGIERISGRLRSPSGKAYIPFFCTYDPEDDAYVASITIQKNTEVGVWQIENILTVDKAKNRANYVGRTTPLLQQATFELIGE